MGINNPGQKLWMIEDIQQMIVEITGDRSLQLIDPKKLTIPNVVKLHTILKKVVASHESMREDRQNWARVLLDRQDDGPLLKG